MSEDSSPEPELVWEDEARAVIQDVKEFVLFINIAEGVDPSDRMIHLNITTLEGENYCVELSKFGFQVVGKEHNSITTTKNETWYDTPYSLLASLSPQYNKHFAESLIHKLESLSSGN